MDLNKAHPLTRIFLTAPPQIYFLFLTIFVTLAGIQRDNNTDDVGSIFSKVHIDSLKSVR